MLRSRQFSCAVAMTILAIVAPAYAGVATFQGLGDLPGGVFESRAFGISPDGTVVIGYGESDSGHRAFRWTSSTGIVELSGAPAGSTTSAAYAASINGDVIVGHVFVNGAYRGFRWTQNTGMTVFEGGEAVGLTVSGAFAVSHDGTIVAGHQADETEIKAAVWYESGTMTTIDIVGGYSGIAEGISANGEIVAGSSPRAGIWEIPFRWTQESGALFIEPAPVASTEFFATEISANGTTLVGARNVNGHYRAFRWNTETGTVELGNTQFGSPHSWAYDVTADGLLVVGLDKFPSNSTEAAMWDQQSNSRSIRSILVDDFGLDLTGWDLYEAIGISDDGSAIVGYGRNPDGHQEAWLATIPASACGCPGDVNNDGAVDSNDIRKFIDCLVGTEENCLCANTDGLVGVDTNDIAYFASTMLAGTNCP